MTRESQLSLVLDQIEIDLPGVQPLSKEERLRQWLDAQEEDTPDVIAALLLLEDDGTRSDRVQLYFDIEAARRPFESEHGWAIPGGEEAWWLYEEAERAYLKGLFLASLLCAHASSERALAGCLLDFESQLDPNWQRWGLTPLAAAAGRLQIITPDLEARLKDLAERRKVSAHYKPPLHPNSVIRRALSDERPVGRGDQHLTARDVNQAYRDEAMQAIIEREQSFGKKITSLLREDALFGMRTVIELLGGEHWHPVIGRL